MESLDAKVGTAKLEKRAPANMIISYDIFNKDKIEKFRSDGDIYYNVLYDASYRIVCYKGSATADIYTSYKMNLYTKGKTVKTDGRKIILAKSRNFEYGKKYAAVHEVGFREHKSKAHIVYTNKDVYSTKNPDGKNVVSHTGGVIFMSKECYDEGDYAEPYDGTVDAGIWYGSKYRNVKLTLTAKPIDKAVQIYIKNKKFHGFTKKADTKNRIYKAGKKEMKKKKSNSCDETAYNIYKSAKSGNPTFNFPVNEVRTGDAVLEPGHIGIYAGNGKQFNGSVTSKKTFMSNAPIFACVYISRTPYAFFRYHK
jgi:hypothetical protein